MRGLGVIAKGVGELIVAVLAQVANMERDRIRERCEDGRTRARASLAATGKTHRDKASLGRQPAGDAREVMAWRKANGASISATAAQFWLSAATVKRYFAGPEVRAGLPFSGRYPALFAGPKSGPSGARRPTE